MDSLSLIVNALTFFSLAFAVYQTILAMRQQKEATKRTHLLAEMQQHAAEQTNIIVEMQKHAATQASSIVEIQQSLSTKFIGEFPSYMDDLIALIEGANRCVTIVCDYVGYGLFSNREQFLQYSQAIQIKINAKVNVRYVLLDKKRRSELHDAQFAKYTRDKKAWERWREEHRTRLETFCKFYACGCTSADIDNAAFKAALEGAELELLDTVFRGGDLREIDFQTSVYFWIRDESEVIFTIPSFSEEAKEFGFRSTDEPLIKSFLGIYDRYSRMARPLELRPAGARLALPSAVAAAAGEER